MIEVWETGLSMPALTGSAKTITWARQIRHRLLMSALEYLHSIDSDDEFADRYERPALGVIAAGWWIDHRYADSEELCRQLASLDPVRQEWPQGSYS
jgi:hypothetical protein